MSTTFLRARAASDDPSPKRRLLKRLSFATKSHPSLSACGDLEVSKARCSRKNSGRLFRRASTTKEPDAMAFDPNNVMRWLETSCPQDVLPKVLAFCGPQKTAALAKTNRHWRNVVRSEGTWRVMCEELYKWKPGDEEPVSWAEHYRLSPCIPVDYSSVHKAMEVAALQPARKSRRSHQKRPQVRPVRILLRPGTYYLKETVNIEARSSGTVTIETIELPQGIYQPGHNANSAIQEVPEAPVSSSSKSSSSRSLRNLMRCHRAGSVEDLDPTEVMEDDEDDWWNEVPSRPRAPPTRATLILRTRRSNEPAFRVRQGKLCLKNIDISHFSEGLDIWNGNAAIQVQPPVGEDEHPIPVHPRPCGWLEGVHITSHSGRGVVNIDGGEVVMRSCAITDCAATGLYIGGPGSSATVESSDVVRNGLGNRSRRMGIARGHSGVYLEQGAARIVDCNISSNTLTGISAVSPDNAILTLEQCDLMNNGTNQLEMPQLGSFARQQSLLRHNRLSVLGRGRTRSGLSIEPATRSADPPRRNNYLP